MTKRVFQVGARMINAPVPDGSLEDNVRQLSQSYPMFRWTRVLEEDATVMDDGTLKYELQLPPAKSNG